MGIYPRWDYCRSLDAFVLGRTRPQTLSDLGGAKWLCSGASPHVALNITVFLTTSYFLYFMIV